MRIPYDVPVTTGRELIALGTDIVAAILLTLKAGWMHASSSPDVHPGAGEVTITERLRDGMRRALKTSGFRWSKMMIVAPGTESRSKADVIVPDGRTDIPLYLIGIFLRFGEHDPHAVIECKRIAGSDRRLCRDYVLEGIDRFRNGKYAENHSAGFMAGYLLSGDPTSAAAGINSYLTHKTRTTENLTLGGVLAEPWAWGSHHPRAPRLQPIELHHAFLSIQPRC